jgi:hypothetical protein
MQNTAQRRNSRAKYDVADTGPGIEMRNRCAPGWRLGELFAMAALALHLVCGDHPSRAQEPETDEPASLLYVESSGGASFLERLSWLDALLNASMILGGMGPVDTLHTTGGKLFAAFYALFSGMIFLVAAGVLVAPIAHRFLHRLQLDSVDGELG